MPASAVRPGEPASLGARALDLLRGRIPTTAAGVERAVALVVSGLRVGTVVQMAPSLAPGLAASARPVLYGICFTVAVVMAVAVSVRALSRDEPLSARVYALDVAVAVALLLVGDLCVPDDARVGTWTGFQPGYALAVLATGAAVRGSFTWLLALVAIMPADLFFRWPAVTSETLSTTVGNVLTYVVMVLVARFATGYLRRIAADADAARAEAAALARREEERRAQLAIHNGAAVMRLLADPELPDDVRAVLQREADRESRRMRSYLQGSEVDLDDDDGGGSRDDRALVDQLRATTERFSDLPLHTALDLAHGVMIDATVAAALDHAVAALLLNTRDHAGARRVVVHADTGPAETLDDEAGRWVVTVHDDGVGFEADPALWGVGLREVVDRQLTDLGVDVEISSTPGHGSTAVLTGPAAATTSGGSRAR